MKNCTTFGLLTVVASLRSFVAEAMLS